MPALGDSREAKSALPDLPEPLPRPVVDNHTHVFVTQEFSGLSVEENLARAQQVGVTRLVEVGCDAASSRQAVGLAQADARVVAAVALHPNDAGRTAEQPGALETELEAIERLLEQPGVRAIGETGLDYYRTREPRARQVQAESFRIHIDWAKRHDKTLVIHDREAHDDILRILDRQGAPSRVVLHCFSGDADFARQCADRGYWLSMPGVVTFASSHELREAAAATPWEQILVETDAPFLTPKPRRGKPNAPYLLPHTVRFLAEHLGADLEDFCDLITSNTDAAYQGAWGADA